jgi:hypothetical protein
VPRLAVLIACSALAACGRFGFDSGRGSGDGDGGIRPPIDSMTNGDAPDSAALFNCKMSHPTALFCDGFEAPLNETYAYSILDNGRAEATTTRAYRGSRALEVETLAINEFKSARWGMFFPSMIASGDLYIRAYYWISAGTQITDHASILTTGYGVAPYPSAYVLLTPGEITLQSDGNSFTFTRGFPREQWTCLELHIAVDATNGQVDLNVDGIAAMTTPPTDTLAGQGYTGLDIGLHYATPAQAPVEMWIDELVVDVAPIGCN